MLVNSHSCARPQLYLLKRVFRFSTACSFLCWEILDLPCISVCVLNKQPRSEIDPASASCVLEVHDSTHLPVRTQQGQNVSEKDSAKNGSSSLQGSPEPTQRLG